MSKHITDYMIGYYPRFITDNDIYDLLDRCDESHIKELMILNQLVYRNLVLTH